MINNNTITLNQSSSIIENISYLVDIARLYENLHNLYD